MELKNQMDDRNAILALTSLALWLKIYSREDDKEMINWYVKAINMAITALGNEPINTGEK